MPNGAVVRLSLTSAAQLLPAPPSADYGELPIERQIGIAVASAVKAICQGIEDQRSGGLAAATKAAAGERIARIYELQQATASVIDFAATVRREGKRQLRQYFDAEFYRQHGAGAGEAMLDERLTGLLVIVAKVSAFERAWAN